MQILPMPILEALQYEGAEDVVVEIAVTTKADFEEFAFPLTYVTEGVVPLTWFYQGTEMIAYGEDLGGMSSFTFCFGYEPATGKVTVEG